MYLNIYLPTAIFWIFEWDSTAIFSKVASGVHGDFLNFGGLAGPRGWDTGQTRVQYGNILAILMYTFEYLPSNGYIFGYLNRSQRLYFQKSKKSKKNSKSKIEKNSKCPIDPRIVFTIKGS